MSKYEIVRAMDNTYLLDVFKMMIEQKTKIFDLCFPEEEIFDYCIEQLKTSDLYIIFDTEELQVAGAFILADHRYFKDKCISCNIHCVIKKEYWGKRARDICIMFRQFLGDDLCIGKILANVPQCCYGVIKLLKDVGFKHEATIKKMLVYKSKTGEPKLYDNLVYSLEFGRNLECLQEVS